MQTHLKVPGSSKHEPSFLHGCDSHSLMLVSHLGPVNPWVQLQANEPGVFTQIPSCSHGEPAKKKIKINKTKKLRYWVMCISLRRFPRAAADFHQVAIIDYKIYQECNDVISRVVDTIKEGSEDFSPSSFFFFPLSRGRKRKNRHTRNNDDSVLKYRKKRSLIQYTSNRAHKR